MTYTKPPQSRSKALSHGIKRLCEEFRNSCSVVQLTYTVQHAATRSSVSNFDTYIQVGLRRNLRLCTNRRHILITPPVRLFLSSLSNGTDSVYYGSQTRPTPAPIMRPAATFVNYISTIKIIWQFRRLCLQVTSICPRAAREPVRSSRCGTCHKTFVDFLLARPGRASREST